MSKPLRTGAPLPENALYYGDNLEVLRRHIDTESVDLVYLDPPFNSNRNYNLLFKEQDGTRAAAQIKAFGDTWRWDRIAADAYAEVVEEGGDVSLAMQAFRTFLGTNDMLAYLSMMAPRLVELRRVLKRTGSLYLHCDPTASHYLKMLLDAVFRPENFRGEITWVRTTTHNDAKRWSPNADIILYYGKSSEVLWNPQYAPHTDSYLESKYRYSDPDGRRYRLDNMTSPNPRPNLTFEWKGYQPPANGWRYSKQKMAQLDADGLIWYPDSKTKRLQLKRYLDEQPGSVLGNVWTDIAPVNSQAQERTGYATQKPEALLERIIEASSNVDDMVLDPFCGCGTAVAVAERLGRRWIGIDVTHLAVTTMKNRLNGASYRVVGEPTTVADAERLAVEDTYQFQFWALGLIHARPAEEKKGADKGIDGRLFFHDEGPGGTTKQLVISVKAGKLTATMVRDLRGVLEREKAAGGVLISMHEPTQLMRAEAASAGFYDSPMWGDGRFPRMQLVTVAELLAGKGIDYPAKKAGSNVTYQPAPKPKRSGGKPGVLFPQAALVG